MNAMLAAAFAAALTVLPSPNLGQGAGSKSAPPVLVPVSDLLSNPSDHVGKVIHMLGNIEVATTALSDEAEPGTSQTTGRGGAVTTAINDVSEITHSDNKLALAGRPVSFARIKVQRIAGVRSFWAGDSRTQRVFVVVDAINLKQAVGSDRELKDGDIVAIDGTVERVPGTLGQVTVLSWGRLDDTDAKALSERDVYVYAKSVKMVAR